MNKFASSTGKEYQFPMFNGINNLEIRGKYFPLKNGTNHYHGNGHLENGIKPMNIRNTER